MLARLAEYATYLEQMAGRLSHELRTPIAVVRSLARQSRARRRCPPRPASTSSAREEGLARLTAILTRMSEATRLEQTLRDAERERFDLGRGRRRLRRRLPAARIPQRAFELARRRSALPVDGAPDLVAQMLDKLVDNAVDFATGGGRSSIALARDGGDGAAVGRERRAAAAGGDGGAAVRVDGVGRGREPDGQATSEPHLGLGLYIVRLIAEFHGGERSSCATATTAAASSSGAAAGRLTPRRDR